MIPALRTPRHATAARVVAALMLALVVGFGAPALRPPAAHGQVRDVDATRTAIPPTLTAQWPTRVAFATAAAQTPTPMPEEAERAERQLQEIRAACATDDPFLATTFFSKTTSNNPNPTLFDNATAIVAFDGKHRTSIASALMVAEELAVGGVFGLAYDWRREQLYAAAYHKVQVRDGPLGPGAIYRVDLASGDVRPWAWLDAGPQVHDFAPGPGGTSDAPAAPYVGRRAIGDIELSEEGDELVAVNLHDRLIYRFAVPDGRLLGAMPHGAMDEPWAAHAVPFGLGVRGGWLFHAVADGTPGEYNRRADARRPLGVRVYRSRLHGGELTEVSRFEGGTAWYQLRSAHGGSIAADIEFTEAGRPIVGLRDRRLDSSGTEYNHEGDLVAAPDVGPSLTFRDARYTQGSLAMLQRLDLLVASGYPQRTCFTCRGAGWWDVESGELRRRFNLILGVLHHADNGQTCTPLKAQGDIEALCPPAFDVPREPTAPPTASPTPPATPVPPTATTTPTSPPTLTATSPPSPTPTATTTPLPAPIYLPLALREHCKPGQQRQDAVLVIDTSSSMAELTRDGRTKLAAAREAAARYIALLDFAAGDRAAIVAFDAAAATLHGLTDDRLALEGALSQLSVGPRTCVPCAVEEAGAQLVPELRREGNVPVIVLLTDGRSNPRPVSEAVAAARDVKAGGVVIFTIGLGPMVEADALREIASAPEHFHRAPDGEDLAAIYEAIAVEVPCAPERFWGRR